MTNYLIALTTQKLLPLAYTLIGFGALVTVHELGHFFFCKVFGIHTPTFSIGFGPELFRKKIGTTDFRLALLPLGGYVEIAGHGEVGQGTQEFAQAVGNTSFNEKPYWQKFLVLTGGIVFNLLFSYAIFTGLFLFGPNTASRGLEVATITAGSAAEKGLIQSNDIITQINQIPLVDRKGECLENAVLLLLEETRKNPNKEISLSLIRQDKPQTLTLVLGAREENNQTVGSLGTSFKTNMPFKKKGFFEALQAGYHATVSWIITIASSITTLFSKRSLDGAGGPIMILASSFTMVQVGFSAFFMFLAIISINLALINLLPFGIVDGGQLLLVTIEAIIRRPIPDVIKMGINLFSLACVAALFLFLTYRDIASLFGDRLLGLYQNIKNLF